MSTKIICQKIQVSTYTKFGGLYGSKKVLTEMCFVFNIHTTLTIDKLSVIGYY